MNFNGLISQTSHVVVVAGLDPTATSRAALALARSESTARKVVMIDLWGNLPEIEQLAGDHDGHGITDVLFCGVSPMRVMRRVDEKGSLHVVTSGNDLAPPELTLLARRWASLRSHARENEELLLVVSRGDTQGLEEFCAEADDVLLCGNGFEINSANAIRLPDEKATPISTPAIAAASSLAESATQLEEQLSVEPPSTPGVLLPPSAAPAEVESPSTPSQAPAPSAATSDGNAREARISRGVQGLPGTVILVLALLGGGLIFLGQNGYFGGGAPDTSSAQPGPALTGSVVGSTANEFAVVNPQDSGSAAAYSVEIAVLNTRAGAEMRLAELSEIRGSTISPVLSDAGETWYRVFAGAFAEKSSADSLQADLRFREIQMSEGDRVVEHPFALRLGMYTPAFRTAAEEAHARYISLGIPAYFLEQTDGSLIMYAGAFESVQQAKHLHDICTNMGLTPRMVYRTGR